MFQRFLPLTASSTLLILWVALFALLPQPLVGLFIPLYGGLVLLPYVVLIYSWLIFNYFVEDKAMRGPIWIAGAAGAMAGTGIVFVATGLGIVGWVQVGFGLFLSWLMYKAYQL